MQLFLNIIQFVPECLALLRMVINFPYLAIIM